MKNFLRKLMTFCIALLCTGAVQAGDVEFDMSAYAKKYAVGLEELKSLAVKGDLDAQIHLGRIYSIGATGLKQDYSEAVRWYKLAAAQGNAYAQFQVGLKCMNGQGIVQDYAEAVHWYKLAAEQGDLDAQNNLGAMHVEGRGVLRSYIKGHMWFNLAAVNGSSSAIQNRDSIAEKLTPRQIAEAQKLARECQARNFKNCD